MFVQCEAMECMDAGQSSCLAARGFSGIVKKGDVSFHVLRGHCIKVLNALRRKPAVVFAQVRVICAHRGFRKSSFHVDVREELINQAFDIRHRGPPFASSSFVVSVPSRSRTERVAHMEDSKDVRSRWKPSLDGNQHSGKSIQVSGMGNAIRKNPRPLAGSGVLKFTGEPSGKLRLPSERSRQPEERPWPARRWP